MKVTYEREATVFIEECFDAMMKTLDNQLSQYALTFEKFIRNI